jgi:hypothetical protein
MSGTLQKLIHTTEMGAGSRVLKCVVGILGLTALAVFYDGVAFRNFSSSEAMDTAQLARNLGEGRGFSTDFVRPFSIHLMLRATTNKLADLRPSGEAATAKPATPEQKLLIRRLHLDEPHPDLANAPLYPALLAAALKLNPFPYSSAGGQVFKIYKPELWIAGVNQLLLLLAAFLVFVLARKLFDERVAWVSTVLFAGAELFWRFSLNGVPTMLAINLVLGLIWVLAAADRQAREEVPSPAAPNLMAGEEDVSAALASAARSSGATARWAVAAGVLVGLAALSRYSFGFLMVPVAIFLATLPGGRRIPGAVYAVLSFLAVMAPWVARNYAVSGTPFGTAGYAVCEGTALFPDDQLQRALNPNFFGLSGADFFRKLLTGLKEILRDDLPRLGGSWVTAFFLTGLLVPFRNSALGRLRWFVAGTVVLFAVVQALARTWVSTETPEVSSENLLAVFAPTVFIFGTSLFFILLDRIGVPFPGARETLVGVFLAVGCLPLLLTLVAPKPSPVSYPPYFPPWIEDKASFLRTKDLAMSDVPWAMAWYGSRQSVWWSLKYRNEPSDKWRNDFFEVNNFIKPVQGLYLSAKAMKAVESQTLWEWGHFSEMDRPAASAEASAGLWQWREGEPSGEWAPFLLQTLVKRQVPTGFPLRAAPRGVVPELFLTDSERVSAKTIQSP